MGEATTHFVVNFTKASVPKNHPNRAVKEQLKKKDQYRIKQENLEK